jgi:eukaryotic-like serine/threonine-protein kinase
LGSPGDLTGALIADKYELLRLIGRGGMGAVYEARNITTFRRCAVKVLLSPELAGDGEVVKRFFREARASGLIESDHVVAAFDSGIDSADRAYYVMECLQGEDLEQTLTRLGQLSPQAAIKIVLQAAAGLASAHVLGIVHRDVKPANLFLAVLPGNEVKVKILDFGVAKVKMEMFNESSNTLTQTGSLLGTPLYMSPEQLRRASAIDESADVWSLGVVLFECLTGELPWGNCDGIGELVTAILTLRLPHIQDQAPWVRPELAGIVQSALSRDPGLRVTSASRLRDALLELVNGDPRLYLHEITVPDEQERCRAAPRLSVPDTVMIGMTPHSGMPMVSAISVSPPKRRTASLTAAFGAALLVGAAAWTFGRAPEALSSSRPPPNPTNPSGGSAGLEHPQPSASETVPADGSAVRKRYLLQVTPAHSRVWLDGVATDVHDGQVAVEGTLGSTHDVVARYAGRATEARVTIGSDGLTPRVLAIVSPAAQSKPPSAGAASLGAAAVAEPAPPVPSPSPLGLSEKFE